MHRNDALHTALALVCTPQKSDVDFVSAWHGERTHQRDGTKRGFLPTATLILHDVRFVSFALAAAPPSHDLETP